MVREGSRLIIPKKVLLLKLDKATHVWPIHKLIQETLPTLVQNANQQLTQKWPAQMCHHPSGLKSPKHTSFVSCAWLMIISATNVSLKPSVSSATDHIIALSALENRQTSRISINKKVKPITRAEAILDDTTTMLNMLKAANHRINTTTSRVLVLTRATESSSVLVEVLLTYLFARANDTMMRSMADKTLRFKLTLVAKVIFSHAHETKSVCPCDFEPLG